MKKLLLTLGTSLTVAAPIAAVVSCSNTETKKNEGTRITKEDVIKQIELTPASDTNEQKIVDATEEALSKTGDKQKSKEEGQPTEGVFATPAGTTPTLNSQFKRAVAELDNKKTSVKKTPNAIKELAKQADINFAKLGQKTPVNLTGTNAGQPANAKPPTQTVNPFINIQQDGLYLWDQTYDGKLWDDKTVADGQGHDLQGIKRIGETSGWALDNSVQLGKRDPKDSKPEDSFYMVYDNDDNDGVNMDNFTDTVFFEDTSIAMVGDIYKINHDVFGDYTAKGSFGGSAEYITFSEDTNTQYKGSLNNFFGSQNNHVSPGKGYSTADDFLKNVKAYVNAFKVKNPTAVDLLLKYYGLKTTPNSQGDYVADPSILNHANWGFAMVYSTTPIFTYEKVFDNAIKITYHDSDTFQCTAAHFRIKEGTNKFTGYGSWSLGNKDWNSYFGHDEAKYVGTKFTK